MASSSSNVQVSYVGMYKDWMKANRELNRDSTIPIEVLLTELRFAEVLSKRERELVDAEKIGDEKLLKLFTEIMPGKGEQGFNQVVEVLTEKNYIELANDLIGGLNRKCSTNSTFPVQNPRIFQARAHLSSLMKDNVDLMAKYWSRDIRVARTEAAFVQVQVLQLFKSENGNPVGSYREVFHKDEKTIHKRILIKADPGCGKTTYVNKLALDWANGDKYLIDTFDFVFLIELQTLTMDVLDAIKCFLPKQSQTYFSSYSENAESKILLILDGFDELVESSQWYSSVMGILEEFYGKSLLIKGFNEESMKQFLINQSVPLPSVGQQSNLSRLLQTPLFCAIYCSLHVGGGDPIELEDSYDLIKALVENSVKNQLKKKTVANVNWWWWLVKWLVENSVTNTEANVKEQLDEIGKFAFQMLDSESVNFLKKFCRSSAVMKPSFDLSTVKLDLLIKRKIPTRGVGGFKEEFSHPHQLIAEYLAARYFACSLTEEQLKQADASALTPVFSYRVSDLPFVRFFLFELLFLYLEKKYDESAFDNFLNIPQLRLIWNIKSNKDIPTLDYVRALDFEFWNSELVNHSRFIPTLSKGRYLSSLRLSHCGLSKNQVEQLVNFINNNCFQKLIKLDLGWYENVGSTPQLFTAVSKCKHLEVLKLNGCYLTVESTTELARCIDNNGLANLKGLDLRWNKNVGSTPQLFTALSKCKHLEVLDLTECEMTVESTTELARCIDNNGLANLKQLYLYLNKYVGSTPQLFPALSKCKHLEVLDLKSCEMTVESTTELARCIDNNGLANLNKLYLQWNKNVGPTPQLFTALSKCKHLERLYLDLCIMTVESTTELARCIDNNGLANLKKLQLVGNENVGSTPQLFTPLSKCKHLERLYLHSSRMTVESTTELARCIDNIGLANLKKLGLQRNKIVGSTPQLFPALSKCKHLEVLYLYECEMTVESTTELAGCIDNNGLANLKELDLSSNENIGSSTDLFHVLHKCSQLQRLVLDHCSMTEESFNPFLSTFNSNTFQQLVDISLRGNQDIKVDDNFFIALEKCLKISEVHVFKSMASDLSEVGRKVKETLEQRGCQF